MLSLTGGFCCGSPRPSSSTTPESARFPTFPTDLPIPVADLALPAATGVPPNVEPVQSSNQSAIYEAAQSIPFMDSLARLAALKLNPGGMPHGAKPILLLPVRPIPAGASSPIHALPYPRIISATIEFASLGGAIRACPPVTFHSSGLSAAL